MRSWNDDMGQFNPNPDMFRRTSSSDNVARILADSFSSNASSPPVTPSMNMDTRRVSVAISSIGTETFLPEGPIVVPERVMDDEEDDRKPAARPRPGMNRKNKFVHRNLIPDGHYVPYRKTPKQNELSKIRFVPTPSTMQHYRPPPPQAPMAYAASSHTSSRMMDMDYAASSTTSSRMMDIGYPPAIAHAVSASIPSVIMGRSIPTTFNSRAFTTRTSPSTTASTESMSNDSSFYSPTQAKERYQAKARYSPIASCSKHLELFDLNRCIIDHHPGLSGEDKWNLNYLLDHSNSLINRSKLQALRDLAHKVAEDAFQTSVDLVGTGNYDVTFATMRKYMADPTVWSLADNRNPLNAL